MWSFYVVVLFFFFFKQKTAYEMRISDWSSDVCSSDLQADAKLGRQALDAGEFVTDAHARAHAQVARAVRGGGAVARGDEGNLDARLAQQRQALPVDHAEGLGLAPVGVEPQPPVGQRAVDVEARQADLRGAVDDVGGEVLVRHAAGFLSVFWCRAMQWQVSLRGPGFSESPIPDPESRPLNHPRPQQVVNVQCADDAAFVVDDQIGRAHV